MILAPPPDSVAASRVTTPLASERKRANLNIRERSTAVRAVFLRVYYFLHLRFFGSPDVWTKCLDEKQQRELGGAVLVTGAVTSSGRWCANYKRGVEGDSDGQFNGSELSIESDDERD